MNSALSKIIEAIWSPAALLLTLRVITLIGLSEILNVNYTIFHDTEQFKIFSAGFSFPTLPDLVQVNTFSLLIILIVFSGIIGIRFFQALKFNSEQISPKSATKLMNSKFVGLIKTPFENFWKIFTWMIFFYFIVVYSLINIRMNLTSTYLIGALILLVTIITIFFFKVINE